jgi:hypothetical protein
MGVSSFFILKNGRHLLGIVEISWFGFGGVLKIISGDWPLLLEPNSIADDHKF